LIRIWSDGTLRTFYNRQAVKIYTKTGDTGETGLFDGTRVSKSDPRVAAYGDVDELNAWLGFARSRMADEADLTNMLVQIQRDLFALGARLADPQRKIAERVTKAEISAAAVERLEKWIDTLDEALPPLRRFLIPGGSEGGSALHLARTVCRRAERAIVGLQEDGAQLEADLVVYVNRLSDLLFVMARFANQRADTPEIEW
jgi:cob(I)alamin adenosyltransferase